MSNPAEDRLMQSNSYQKKMEKGWQTELKRIYWDSDTSEYI